MARGGLYWYDGAHVRRFQSRLRVYNIYDSAQSKMKGDIGMANCEKKVEQEAAYPIPISLYNCYRTVWHEKRYISGVASYASLLMPHCPVTVVQRYRDGVCSLLFHLFFIICHPYIPLHLEEMIFILVVNKDIRA